MPTRPNLQGPSLLLQSGWVGFSSA